MYWPIRVCGLFLSTILVTILTLWIGSFIGRFEFQEGLSVFPIWRVALLSTVFSWMFPGAYWAAGGGSWKDNAGFSIFMFTSLLIIPLLLIFPPPEHDIYRVAMTRSEYITPFFVVWFVHGAINAWHVRLLSRRQLRQPG